MTFTKYVMLLDVTEDLDIDTEGLDISDQVLDVELELEFDLVVHDKGRPAVMYLPNGDPGYPEEPAEYEIELTTNIKYLLEAEVSDRVSNLFQEFIPKWVDENYEKIADEAFENFINNGD